MTEIGTLLHCGAVQKLGESFRRLHGWRMAILAGNEAFESAFHMRPAGRRALWNGPIACVLLTYPAITM